ncbi:hypothetical protein [Croceicoccus marinus]|uniref:Uncharacterized protein n=1 Tax=Croceicoccus marinus TaxID=450378 RepID=A0A7G6W1E9_9SPHN|nr:hypothetical protein [Croceicoccus marinus]QNE07814.1 hypothetical protein H4O24_19940 [Croceicoccus marinus]
MQPIPEDFVLASRAVPKGSAPVLALRRSPVTGLVFEALTVRYDAERSRNHWRRLDGSSVCDDGYDVLAWREAPDLLAYRSPASASRA